MRLGLKGSLQTPPRSLTALKLSGPIIQAPNTLAQSLGMTRPVQRRDDHGHTARNDSAIAARAGAFRR